MKKTKEEFEERAAIMEFDGGLPRDIAETKAAVMEEEPQALDKSDLEVLLETRVKVKLMMTQYPLGSSAEAEARKDYLELSHQIIELKGRK